MISPAVLEAPGAWRRVALVLGLMVALAPTVPLLWSAVSQPQFFDVGSGFMRALGRSLAVGGGASLLALAAGLPSGLIAALYNFPFKHVLLAASALPLVVPSFLWAIGLSAFRIRMGFGTDSILSGRSGSVVAFAAFGIPLVVFATFLAARRLPNTQVDAARIAGGEFTVLRYAARAVFPVASAVALLAGVRTLSDPGPGQILGFTGVGTEVLVSFSALYDFDLAARQCLVLAAVVLLCASPLALVASRPLADAFLARNPYPIRRQSWSLANWLGPMLFAGLILGTLLVPLLGLTLPALERFELVEVADTLRRTGFNTVLYALLAALVATVLGLWLALAAGRDRSLRVMLLAGLLLIFALPPVLGALGTVYFASGVGPWLDPILRSRWTVGIVQGLGFVPITALLAARALGEAPRSWALAGAVHGVPLGLYLVRVVGPFLVLTCILGSGLVALLATAEVGTVLLLQPPGESSLPVAIFTVMANARESLVASLCLVYVGLTAATLAIGWLVFRFMLDTSRVTEEAPQVVGRS